MKNDKKTKKQFIAELESLHQSAKTAGSQGESEQAAFYRLATEHSDEAVIIVSKSNRLFFNRRYMELAGCNTPEELEQKPFLSGVHPDDQKIIKEMIQKRQAGESAPLRYECRLLKPDGSVMHFEISSSLITHMGQPASLGYIRDISDRKQAEARIIKAQREWKNIFEAIGQPTAIINPQFIILAANSALMDVSGMSLHAILGKKCHEIFHGEESKNNPDGCPLAKLILTGKMETAEMDVGAFGGTSLITCIPVFDNENRLEQIIHIATDVTERKRMEESLRKSESTLKSIFLAAPIGIGLVSNRIIKRVNDRLCEMLGYSREDLLEQSARILYPTDDDYEFVGKEKYAQITERGTGTVETRWIRKDGSIIKILLSSTPLDSANLSSGVTFTAVDITERVHAEESRSKLEAQLFQAQKMEAIGTLAGGIAHDFNNILMGIQGYTSLAKLDFEPNHPHYERFQKIEEQIMSGANLTRQLLGFARGGKYEVKPTNLNQLLKTSAEIFSRTKKEISISHKLQKDLCWVDADQGQIDQVFLNIYINAWQAMSQGGDIYIESQNVTLNDNNVKPYDVHPGKYAKISITDTGTGMDTLTQERIFEPFFTTKQPGKGTGMGLASAYGIIKNHGGFITVQSELEKGSTFSIFLPASHKKPNEVEESSASEEKLLAGYEHILIVDDELNNVVPTKELLNNLGYNVTAVGSGQEAITLYAAKWKEFDLVILDMIMPGISGGQTFDALLEINPTVKVILSSGYSVDGEAQQIMNRGCKGFIQKPFRISNLSKKIREILGASGIGG